MVKPEISPPTAAAAAPASGWDREIPRYRAARDIWPATKPRYRLEPPFAHMADSDIWQYGTGFLEAGEIVETKDWPHPSFQPLNYSAGKVLEFFNTRQKSRLPLSPWRGNGLVLDDGLSGPLQPNVSIGSGVTPA